MTLSYLIYIQYKIYRKAKRKMCGFISDRKKLHARQLLLPFVWYSRRTLSNATSQATYRALAARLPSLTTVSRERESSLYNLARDLGMSTTMIYKEIGTVGHSEWGVSGETAKRALGRTNDHAETHGEVRCDARERAVGWRRACDERERRARRDATGGAAVPKLRRARCPL